jgi:prevent-host-death family protein
MEVGVHEAKTHFSQLLRRVAAGEEIVIRRGGTIVAKLVPAGDVRQREFGIDEGVFSVPDDFDAPLPDEVLTAFES